MGSGQGEEEEQSFELGINNTAFRSGAAVHGRGACQSHLITAVWVWGMISTAGKNPSSTVSMAQTTCSLVFLNFLVLDFVTSTLMASVFNGIN